MNQNNQSEPNFLKNWKPKQDICIVLDDITGSERTPDEIDQIFDIIRSAANNHGFDLSSWGLRDSFEKSIQKRYIRAKIKEAVAARDLQLAQLYPECSFLKDNAPQLPEINH